MRIQIIDNDMTYVIINAENLVIPEGYYRNGNLLILTIPECKNRKKVQVKEPNCSCKITKTLCEPVSCYVTRKVCHECNARLEWIIEKSGSVVKAQH